MHLGRRPSRLPERLEGDLGIAPSTLEPRAAWRSTVDRAIQSGVDAVLLAGDVVDSKNHFMEAYGALLEGVQRLARHDIDVVCVAGNHDTDALPRLAAELDNVHLLGPDGTWSSYIVRRDGEPLVRVIGWSFPRKHVDSNPLDAMPASMAGGRYEDEASDDLCTVGLLHCDLDGGKGSRYAPVSRAAFERTSLTVFAWFLGHVHVPTIESGPRPLGYLGSLVGLDAGELGPHGPWLANLRNNTCELEHIPLSPIRWESREVAVDDCDDAEALGSAMGRALQQLAEELSPQMDGTRVVGVRFQLAGTCPASSEEIRMAIHRVSELELSSDDVYYFVDKVTDQTRLPVDLAAIAKQEDPAGLMALRLLNLEQGEESCARLVTAARFKLEKVTAHGNFGDLDPACTTDEEVRQILMRVARRALDELLAQKLSTSAPGHDEPHHEESEREDEVIA
jgi:DNA repair protein SbcD/Mre11